MMPSPPRVVHLLNRIDGGGMERQAMQLVRGLNDGGSFTAGVAVHTPSAELTTHTAALPLPVSVHPLKHMYDVNALRQVRLFARFLREHGIRIVHTHDFYTTTFGIAAGLLAGVPVRVASRRELDVFTRPQRAVEHLAYRGATAVVANCDRLGLQLLREGVAPKRIAIIRNGVDPTLFTLPRHTTREAAAAVVGLDPTLRYVLMVANVHNFKKDHELLVRAAAPVLHRREDAALVVAGATEPARQAALQRMASDAGVSRRVLFIGHCKRLAELLFLADVCVLVSHSEGLPNVILEYMAASRPVVATAVGGVAELVRHGSTGYLARPGDAGQLSAQIEELLAAPELACRMGEAGRRRVLSEFAFQQTLEQTLALYDRLLSAAHRR